jgi:hypothetical protein
MELNSVLTISEHDRPSTRSLAIDSIVIDESVQARAKMMTKVVEEYTEAMHEGDVFPALDVFQKDDIYILADGFTRHAAAKLAGRTEIDCTVHAGDLRDAKLFAVGANSRHGHPRSDADKRCAVLKLLNDEEWCKWSAREIARQCRVGHQLVEKLRTLTGRATSKRQFRSKNGNVATMNTERIGRRSKHKSRRAGGLGDQSGLLPSTPQTAANAETAAAEESLIDQSDVVEDGQVFAEQRIGAIKALVIMAEFAKFVIVRTSSEGSIIVTITEEDADQFRSLRDRAELAIQTVQLSD